ncbi:MAG: phosphodiester glycosidase family protein [Streptococcaceae bacterium]|jgi:exopolysaccharide biosynthesis protein|nr:phosphodiester glycosidase family protein [Streptococcaceae bacterium]
MTQLEKEKIQSKRTWLKRLLISLTVPIATVFTAIMLFFHTNLFSEQRDLWVQTAMATSSHKWLATAFMSESEIDNILEKYEVSNTTNTDASKVTIKATSSTTSTSASNTSLKKISGSTYQGYVLTIKDPTTVQLMNTLTASDSGSLLSNVVSSSDSITAAINAAGFNFSRHGGRGSSSSNSALDSLTIMDGELLYGDAETSYQMIGMSVEGKLVLGTYTYKEAIAAGINDAISFGPYLVVNGENQVDNENTGGYQPRTAIGQAEDGRIFFVVIEGRSTSSTGATLYQLQEIMNDLGAVNATNLDGGGSSELYYNDSLVNDLSNGSERAIPNAFVVTED